MRALDGDIRLILLDAGNTLLFVDYPYLARAAGEIGAHVTAAKLRSCELHGRLEVDRMVRTDSDSTDATRWRRYFERIYEAAGVTREQFERVAPLLKARHEKIGLWMHVRPWTKPALASLQRLGYRMGVVSNADGRVESWLVQKELGPFFDVILDSKVVGIEKPDPRIFAMALERTGFRADQAIYVGDLYTVDVVGARAAGITPVLLDPLGTHPATDCVKIRALSDLKRLLPPAPGRRASVPGGDDGRLERQRPVR